MKTLQTINKRIMKNILILILMISGLGFGQIVNIPDANFRSWLMGSNNAFTAKDLQGNATLVDSNNDGEIQISEAQNISSINISHVMSPGFPGAILDLTGLSFFSNLVSLTCNDNLIQSIPLNGLISLKFLNCRSNPISSINLSQNVLLETLNCTDCLLQILDVSNNINLKQIDCDFNSITNLSTVPSIKYLRCNNNQLTNLDLTGLNNLISLYCNNNQLTNLILPTVSNLDTVNCIYNNLTQVDVSNVSGDNFNFGYNPNLKFINMKNGVSNSCITLLGFGVDYICSMFLGLPNLEYICVDQDENLNWNIQQANINMGSYCTSVPGGNFNTITGTTSFDINNNGCDSTDPIVSNFKVKINDGTSSGSTFTNNSGIYNFYVQQPNLTITPQLENPTYFNVSPTTASFNFPTNNNSTQIQDFCITANGIHKDLEVVLIPLGQARPGFDANYKIIYKNKGNQTLSGDVNLTFDDARTDFVSSIPILNTQILNVLSWNFIGLLPFETRSIDLVLNLNSPQENPALNSGDVLDFSTAINPVVGDEMPNDNLAIFHQNVINSYDPNDKTCTDGETIDTTKIGEYLHYNINFENTGTADAINVVVKDIIDTTMYDINSLQVMYASHDVHTDINGNVVEFIFKNINLPASAVAGGPGGHGNVLFKIKTLPNLPTATIVKNTANIFFDYNFQILTNEARTTFANLNNTSFMIDNSVSIAPNPSTSKINIFSKTEIKTMQLFDIQGRIIESFIGNKNILDISNQANGIYFLKITTENGAKIEKIVKE
ncbi:MAG: T9SS type A sorting domain-containing protein [Flavobacterium sp.]|nr:T9SS type A sorting domain-containing protein [Flavobacterium sp.]